MPVESVTEIPFRGHGGSLDQFGVRRYKRIFQVYMTNYDAGPLEATSSPLLPAYMSVYVNVYTGETDIGATARNITATQNEDDPHIWWVEYDYSSERPPYVAPDNPFSNYNTGNPLSVGHPSEVNPTLRPPQISWSTGFFTRHLDQDMDDVACINSARQPFAQGVIQEVPYLVLTFAKNSLSDKQQDAMDFAGTVNDANWGVVGHTILPGQALCKGITAEFMLEQNIQFWRVSYVFWIMPVTSSIIYQATPEDDEILVFWNDLRLDAGSWELIAGAIAPIVGDATAMAVNGMVPLDGAGRKLADGEPFVYKFFRTHKSTNFSSLGLPP